MDWSKVDAALAGALESAPFDRVALFVQVDPRQVDEAVLAEWHLGPPGPSGLLTADLSGDEVGALTEQPWVVRVRLSQRLRPLDRPDEA